MRKNLLALFVLIISSISIYANEDVTLIPERPYLCTNGSFKEDLLFYKNINLIISEEKMEAEVLLQTVDCVNGKTVPNKTTIGTPWITNDPNNFFQIETGLNEKNIYSMKIAVNREELFTILNKNYLLTIPYGFKYYGLKISFTQKDSHIIFHIN